MGHLITSMFYSGRLVMEHLTEEDLHMQDMDKIKRALLKFIP